MILTKICGLKDRSAVEAAVDGGAGFIGFVAFPASPRDIDPNAAARLAAPVRARVKIVAVTVDPDNALLERLVAILAPDYIQLHGKETPERVADIRRRLSCGLIKALPVAEAADLDAALRYDDLVDHLMFDAKSAPGDGLPGGLGRRFDWTLTAGRRFSRPWFLAGGLDPWNVGEAVRLSGAPMVDVSSGVERGAGLKDPALIGAFLEAVRRA